MSIVHDVSEIMRAERLNCIVEAHGKKWLPLKHIRAHLFTAVESPVIYPATVKVICLEEEGGKNENS